MTRIVPDRSGVALGSRCGVTYPGARRQPHLLGDGHLHRQANPMPLASLPDAGIDTSAAPGAAPSTAR